MQSEAIILLFSEKKIPWGIKSGKVVFVLEKELSTNILDALTTVQVPFEVINVRDFEDTLIKVSKMVRQNLGKDFIVDFTDAQLKIALATVSAFLLLDVKATMLIDDKQLKTTDISPLKIPLSNDHIEIIKVIDQGFTSVSSISKRLSIPLTSTWRRVRELKKEEVIDDTTNLTYKGKLLLEIFQD